MQRGKWIEIDAVDTDVTVFAIPKNKIAEITKVDIRNPTASDLRFRLWDTFTDTGGAAHRVVKLDVTVVAGDSIIADLEGSRQVLGTLVAQSTVATIQAYVGVSLR